MTSNFVMAINEIARIDWDGISTGYSFLGNFPKARSYTPGTGGHPGNSVKYVFPL
jgi:hypothetical protein